MLAIMKKVTVISCCKARKILEDYICNKFGARKGVNKVHRQ